MKLFSAEIWIGWMAATSVAAATMVSVAYSVFETKDTSTIRTSTIEKRLDRIESKIDELMRK